MVRVTEMGRAFLPRMVVTPAVVGQEDLLAAQGGRALKVSKPLKLIFEILSILKIIFF